MGSVPRLKIKKELNYRRGRKDAVCGQCAHYIMEQIIGIGGVDLGAEGRCRIIGMKPSVRYRVLPDNVCDRFEMRQITETQGDDHHE